jgi:hypothetical protein
VLAWLVVVPVVELVRAVLHRVRPRTRAGHFEDEIVSAASAPRQPRSGER